jgi:hypothetical protein
VTCCEIPERGRQAACDEGRLYRTVWQNKNKIQGHTRCDISNASLLISKRPIGDFQRSICLKNILPPTRKKVAFLFENLYLAKYSTNFDKLNKLN